MDPLELRLRNLPEDQPNQQWRKYFPIGAEKIGWNKRHPTGDATAGPIKRGLGCAANRWAGAGNAGTRASCEIMPDGSVRVSCDVHCGGKVYHLVFRQGTFALWTSHDASATPEEEDPE